MKNEDPKMIDETTPEQVAARYARYIDRVRDDMAIACRIFQPSIVAETFLALSVDLLMSIGGPEYAKQVLNKISKALAVDPEATAH